MQLFHQELPRALLERAPEPALTTINGVIMSVVFVTAQPTFTGIIGSSTTLSPDDGTSDGLSASISHGIAQSSSQRIQSITTRSSLVQSSAVPTTTPSIIAATALYPSTTTQKSITNTAAYGSSQTSVSSTSSSNDGMSTGAKIGLGAGIVCVLGLIAVVLLVVLARKRRRQEQEMAESEKKTINNQSSMADPAGQFQPSAPRLSIRPVSRLIPEFIGGGQQKNRHSQGNMLTSVSEHGNNKAYSLSPISPVSQGPDLSSDRPRTAENPFQDPENPFADPEKGLKLSGTAGHLPFGPGATHTPPGPPEGQRDSAPTAASFPIPHTQVQSQRSTSGSVPSALVPGNGARYELPASAPSPVIAPGPGPETPQGNVYRILMDFRPTMDDELELRAGQLVRLLHEYDDGWALCIRLDRSQQGVVPRTCLAAKPSKPRPGQGPGPGPHSRPTTPQGRPRGPPGSLGPQGPPASYGPPNAGIVNPRGPASAGPGTVRAQSPGTDPMGTGALNQTLRPLSPGPRPPPSKSGMSPVVDDVEGPNMTELAEQKEQDNSMNMAKVQGTLHSPKVPNSLTPGVSSGRSESPGLAM